MPDSNDNIIDKTVFVSAIVFGIFNIILGLIFLPTPSIFSIFITEGILLLYSAFILSKEINFNVLFFFPIIVGIGTILIGSMNVYSNYISGDESQVAMASEVTLGGILLIISSFMIIKNLNYKKIIFISLAFIIMNIIIDFIHFHELMRYYHIYFTGRKILISIKIFLKIIILIVSIIIINKKSDYKYLLFIPIIFGIKILIFAAIHLYIKIGLSSYYTTKNDFIMLGILIFSGILLITLLFRIINKLDNRIVVLFVVPFGIVNAICGMVYLIDTLSSFSSGLLSVLIISILMITESIFLFILSYKLSIIASSKKSEISQ